MMITSFSQSGSLLSNLPSIFDPLHSKAMHCFFSSVRGRMLSTCSARCLFGGSFGQCLRKVNRAGTSEDSSADIAVTMVV